MFGEVNGTIVDVLTPREREVVGLMAQGITASRDIAERLVVSKNTVHFHRMNIYNKLGVASSAQVIVYALTTGRVVESTGAVPVWQPTERPPEASCCAGYLPPVHMR